MTNLISRYSGIRLRRGFDNPPELPNFDHQVYVTEQKPYDDGRGIQTKNFVVKKGIDFTRVPQLSPKEFSIAHILQTGNFPSMVNTVGSLSELEASRVDEIAAGSIDADAAREFLKQENQNQNGEE